MFGIECKLSFLPRYSLNWCHILRPRANRYKRILSRVPTVWPLTSSVDRQTSNQAHHFYNSHIRAFHALVIQTFQLMSFSLKSRSHLLPLRNVCRAVIRPVERNNIIQSQSQGYGSPLPLEWHSSAIQRFHFYHTRSFKSAIPSKESGRVIRSTPLSKEASPTPQTSARQGKPNKKNPKFEAQIQSKVDLSEEPKMSTSDRSHLTHSERTKEEPRDDVWQLISF